MRYDRARVSLDRHATYIVATFLAGAAADKSARSGQRDRSRSNPLCVKGGGSGRFRARGRALGRVERAGS